MCTIDLSHTHYRRARANVKRRRVGGEGALPQIVLLLVVKAQHGVFGVRAWVIVRIEHIREFGVEPRRKRVVQMAEGDAVRQCCARCRRKRVAADKGQGFPERLGAVGLWGWGVGGRA